MLISIKCINSSDLEEIFSMKKTVMFFNKITDRKRSLYHHNDEENYSFVLFLRISKNIFCVVEEEVC